MEANSANANSPPFCLCFVDLLNLIFNCCIIVEENNLKLPQTQTGGLGGLGGPGGTVSPQQDSTNSPVKALEMLMAINTTSVCVCVCVWGGGVMGVCANDTVNG